MNTTGSSKNLSCRDLRDPTVTKVPIPLLYSLVFIGGLLLNILAAWIFCHVPNKSSFVIYLKNIVAADLLLIVTLPFKILSDTPIGTWQLKAIVCRYTAVVFYSSMYVSIIFLGLISLDRYLKIVQPQKNLFMQKVTVAKVISVGCWVFIMSFALPSIILTNKDPTPETAGACMKLKSDIGRNWHEFIIIKCQVIFWAVFLLLTLCYLAILKKLYWSKRKFQKDSSTVVKKANRNIFSILAVFFICFVPYQFIRIPYDKYRLANKNCVTSNSLYYAKEFTLLLCAFNVCLDPVIYFLLCKAFTKQLCRKLRMKRRLTIKMSEGRNKSHPSTTSNQTSVSRKATTEQINSNSLQLTSDTKESIELNLPWDSSEI
ncbi:P2Y purinoceptor 14-like [Hypanus sabinus]|uniref:P2Y purinoceptor 14-like n=1 Tax=Hypanus sabinus TaxID=79690 RepID=UPI0028C38210|nr:P2Y purinoceptor 14-like [Hypanus sabinus]XP_059848742.1 P2Y purinoceptor 14-like [Hypanus sabinus]